MADISDIQAAQAVKIVGSDDTGVEQTPVGSTSDGELKVASNRLLVIDDLSSTATLTNGSTFTGAWVDLTGFNTVTTSVKTDQSGIMYMEFSPDGTNSDSSFSFNVAANANEVHRLTVTKKFYRCRFTNNSGTNQTFMRLQSLKGDQPTLSAPLNVGVSTDADSIITKSILFASTSSGKYVQVPGTSEGHLEVAIHDPLLPFGSLHTEKMTPIFQTDGVYGINPAQVKTTSTLSGTTTGTNGIIYASTGTTIYSSATVQSRKRLKYRPGQGTVGRFTAIYTSPAANSYQLAGFGHAEDGVYFGYKDLDFGILHVVRGVREVQTLTVTVGATSASNVTITLNSVAFTVPVTNSSNVNRTAYEIYKFEFAGWDTEISGATVKFIANSAGDKVGTFSFAAGTTGASASISQTNAGVASTDTFIPQSSWNGDVCDGTGNSGFILDPTKGNVFQIGIQYLGFGAVTFYIETTSEDLNNATFTCVHTLKFPNSMSLPSFGNPSFPFTMAAYSAGSTTNLSVGTASFAGFVEGDTVKTGGRFTYVNQLTTVGSTNYQALFTVQATRVYQGRTSQIVTHILGAGAAVKHSNPVMVFLLRDATLAGNPNFVSSGTASSILIDTSATTATITDNSQIIWTGLLGDTGELMHSFEDLITIQPGETITMATRSTFGTPSYVVGTINTREDQ